MVTNTRSQIPIPATTAMADEPARTVGGIFADKAMVKTFVSAAVGLIALIFRFTTTDQVIEDVTTVISLGSMLVTAMLAQWEARQRARQQAEETRDAVYAPTTVADLVGQHNAETDVVRQFPRTATDPDGDGRLNL